MYYSRILDYKGKNFALPARACDTFNPAPPSLSPSRCLRHYKQRSYVFLPHLFFDLSSESLNYDSSWNRICSCISVFILCSILVQKKSHQGRYRQCLEAAWESHYQRVSGPASSLLLNNFHRAKGLKAIYTGLMPTHPGIFCVVMIWDSIHSHHKFQHSPSYKQFIVSVLPILAGDLEVIHFEITDRKALKKALESPVTQISHLYIKKGFVADFLKAYNAGFEKYVVGEKYNGMCINYPYEDAYGPSLLRELTLLDSLFMRSWDGRMSKITTMSWRRRSIQNSGLVLRIASILTRIRALKYIMLNSKKSMEISR